jgi:2-C-methyl-D-erythritol 4-phosphate cytidylyltransferase
MKELGDSQSGVASLDRSNKVFLTLFENNQTVLELTLKHVLLANVCKGIVVVCREDEFGIASEFSKRAISAYASNREIELIMVRGGETRQESVLNGLNIVKDRAEYFLVHDGARPLCSSKLIKKVAERARETGAAILATPVVSTLKKVDANLLVESTVSREAVWSAQTPQVFRADILLDAYDKAQAENFLATDESSMVERLGIPVSIVRGSSRNIKITTPEDLISARLFERLE